MCSLKSLYLWYEWFSLLKPAIFIDSGHLDAGQIEIRVFCHHFKATTLYIIGMYQSNDSIYLTHRNMIYSNLSAGDYCCITWELE